MWIFNEGEGDGIEFGYLLKFSLLYSRGIFLHESNVGTREKKHLHIFEATDSWKKKLPFRQHLNRLIALKNIFKKLRFLKIIETSNKDLSKMLFPFLVNGFFILLVQNKALPGGVEQHLGLQLRNS